MNQVALSKRSLRIKHLIEIGNGELAAFDFELGFLAHTGD
jgi:hypothetical protein